MAALFSRHYGRGPERTHTYLDDDYVLCVMDDSLTPMESTLIEAGQRDLVDHTRTVMQEAVRDDFVAAVESVTGRKVLSFLSANDVRTRHSSELFLLEPRDGAL